jgi:A/G-specific adenine glycosylase
LVAAVMAQQTQMARVLPKFAEFIAAYPTVDALAAAPIADVLRRWAPLGYNLRALRLHRAAQRIVASGGFPRTAAELARIQGIGPFTAAIVASFALGERVAAVDTNVRRVLARLTGDASGSLSDAALRSAAERLLSRRAPGRWNQAMMDLGATVCSARAPQCGWCAFRPSGRASAQQARAEQRGQPPFRRSRRYYRGRIVQALRELPPQRSLTPQQLFNRLEGRDGLSRAGLRGLVAALRRDGLVRVLPSGRVRLP